MRKAAITVGISVLLVAAISGAAPANAASKTGSGSIGPMYASCGTAGPNLENRVEGNAPADGTANQRSGSSTSCPAPGALQPTDDALYFCYTAGHDGYTWTYLRNQRTTVRGWVRDDLLDLNVDGFSRGSIKYCGF